MKNGTGSPHATLANASHALRKSPELRGVLAYDVFSARTMMVSPPPWDTEPQYFQPRAWTPHDDLLTTEHLQRLGIAVKPITAAQAVELVGREQSYHPVLGYLDGLQHDGTARLENWLTTYLGAEQNQYNRAVGRAMMIAAVARIRDPGCKVDTAPILEGEQGAMKSTAVKALFSPWFTDEIADFGSKDAAMQMSGAWGIEVSELDAMSRMEVAKIKAFITRTTDRYRPPYGSRIVESDRSCVFWGTTNSDSYLKDETGGRRFWPIRVGRIDIDGLHKARDQLWAEAQVLYAANVPWWLTKADLRKDAEQHQRDRYVGDPWDEPIQSYLAAVNDDVSMEEVMRDALHLDVARRSVADQQRVVRCLRSLGYVRVQVRNGDKRAWRYRRTG
ncbi:virulence-associated E family protein [Tardiphaga sp.]|uniref:virulence-associated E family protein n=1 Tax=Tardiphaga sp. TaxID=1926292 RepID=UPI0026307C67|nr:virulence-associated E family protein [Tardiphaga sp.]MDB5617436.1 virulence-associated family protein [Tardiphaga sp.]